VVGAKVGIRGRLGSCRKKGKELTKEKRREDHNNNLLDEIKRERTGLRERNVNKVFLGKHKPNEKGAKPKKRGKKKVKRKEEDGDLAKRRGESRLGPKGGAVSGGIREGKRGKAVRGG